MLLKTNKLTKSYGGTTLFSDLTFSITTKDKIGFIGRNGTGKTTLLNILIGEDQDYDGEVTKISACRIGYLAQDIKLNKNKTLFEECLSHFKTLLEMKSRLSDLEDQIQQNPKETDLQQKYGELLHQFEEQDGYNIKNKVSQVLVGLGFSDDETQRPIASLSGGELRRGLLAKQLLNESNLLILDEPTNHLDVFSIRWLEYYLKSFQGAICLVSHDRRFLEGIVNKIYELRDGTLHQYKGNFSYYLAEKENRYRIKEKEYQLQQEKIAKEEEFIRKNIAGQKTKQAQSRRKGLEKITRIQKPTKVKKWKFRFFTDISPQNNVVVVNDFSKSFGDKTLISNLSLNIRRGDKVCVIGKNGCGKSTLIKSIVNKEIKNDSVRLNDSLRFSYFDQGNQHLDLSLSLLDTIQNSNPHLTEQEVRNILGQFEFVGDKVFSPVQDLSGGEKTRLSLLNTVLSPTDILILDEPTNHLDIETREVLGEALNDFCGTVIAISHDRNFIDQFANKLLFIFDAKGYLLSGNFIDNAEKISQIMKETSANPSDAEKKLSSPKANDNTANKKNINVFKVQKVEQGIALLEQKKELLMGQLADKNLYSNYKKYQEVEKQLNQVNTKLNESYHEWEQLHF